MDTFYHTIEDAWFQVCQRCLKYGQIYTIERGSYEGQQRKQLNILAFTITHPVTRPLGFSHSSSLVKDLVISDDRSIHRYFEDYLINPEVSSNETYTYGSRIVPHLERVALMLRETPCTNQAVIEIARPEDILLNDPPCLRMLAWNLTDKGLQLTSCWRSWDLFAGLPLNLGGIQLLNEMMAEWSDHPVGPQVCCSSGGHLYDHHWKMFD